LTGLASLAGLSALAGFAALVLHILCHFFLVFFHQLLVDGPELLLDNPVGILGLSLHFAGRQILGESLPLEAEGFTEICCSLLQGLFHIIILDSRIHLAAGVPVID